MSDFIGDGVTSPEGHIDRSSTSPIHTHVSFHCGRSEAILTCQKVQACSVTKISRGFAKYTLILIVRIGLQHTDQTAE